MVSSETLHEDSSIMTLTTINNEDAWIKLTGNYASSWNVNYSILYCTLRRIRLNTTKITTLRYYEVDCYLNSFTPYLVSNHQTHQSDAYTGLNKLLICLAMINDNQGQAEKSSNLFIILSCFIFLFLQRSQTVKDILCGYNVRDSILCLV